MVMNYMKFYKEIYDDMKGRKEITLRDLLPYFYSKGIIRTETLKQHIQAMIGLGILKRTEFPKIWKPGRSPPI